VGRNLEVVGGLAVVLGGVVEEFVFPLGNHRSWFPLCVQAAGAVRTGEVTQFVLQATGYFDTTVSVAPACVTLNKTHVHKSLRKRTAYRCSDAAVAGRCVGYV
jgi:hypothetical protein